MRYREEYYQHFNLSPQAVYEIFSNVNNLNRLLPWGVRLDILSPRHLELVPGMLFDYKLRLFGIPIPWRTRIDSVQNPSESCRHLKFVDSQARGPYKSFAHTHEFRDVGAGCLMVDQIDYELWGGPAAGLVNMLFVRPTLRYIFRHRARVAETWLKEVARGA